MSIDIESKVLELLDKNKGWTDEELKLLSAATAIPSVRMKLWSMAKPIEPTYQHLGSKGYFWWDESGQRHFSRWLDLEDDPQPLRIYNPGEDEE